MTENYTGMSGMCDKCNKFIEDLNTNEKEEFDLIGGFVCSTCINEEMEEIIKEEVEDFGDSYY